jgi:hypothetical protein
MILLVLLFRGLIAFFADFVLLGGVLTAGMGAFFGLGDGFVAATGFLLAFFAELLVLMSIGTTFMLAFLALGFCLDATALIRNEGVGANQEADSKGQSRQRVK